MYQRVVVPVDGSPASDRGLQEAVGIAREQHARLRVIHVVEHSALPALPSSGLYVRAVLAAVRRSGEMTLQHALGVARAHDVEAEPCLVENVMGRVAEAIVEEARNWQADLIVMGTHGRRGASRLILGSDAEQVVRTSEVPVMLVRAPAAAAARQVA